MGAEGLGEGMNRAWVREIALAALKRGANPDLVRWVLRVKNPSPNLVQKRLQIMAESIPHEEDREEILRRINCWL